MAESQTDRPFQTRCDHRFRMAQAVSGVVYCCIVTLLLFLVHNFPSPRDTIILVTIFSVVVYLVFIADLVTIIFSRYDDTIILCRDIGVFVKVILLISIAIKSGFKVSGHPFALPCMIIVAILFIVQMLFLRLDIEIHLTLKAAGRRTTRKVTALTSVV